MAQRRIGKLATETLWAGATRVVSMLLYIIANVALARALGARGFGEWSYFWSTFHLLLVLSSGGLVSASQVFVARAKQRGNLDAVLRASFRLGMVTLLAAGLAMWLAGPLLAEALGRVEMARLFVTSSVLLVLQGLLELAKHVLEGNHRIKYNFVVSSTEYGGKAAGACLCWHLGADPLIVLHFYTLATGIALLVAGSIVYLKLRVGGDTRSSPKLTRELIAYSLPMLIVAMSLSANAEIDTIMLGYMASDFEVGNYAAAKQLAAKSAHIGGIIAMGALQPFASMDSTDRARLTELFRRVLVHTSAVYVAVVILLLAFAPWVMPLLFGAELAGSGAVLQALTPYIFAAGLSQILAGVLNYRGRASWRVWIALPGIVANIACNLYLIPAYGALGAAMASSLTQAPVALLLYLAARRSFRSTPTNDSSLSRQ